MTIRALALLLVTVLTGCAGERPLPAEATTAAGVTGITASTVTSTTVGTTEYLPGLEARIHRPGVDAAVPLLVMVPGGGWETADPAGFEGLARHLAASGILAAPVEVRAGRDDVVYPVPVEDVLCAVAYVVNLARSAGIETDLVAVMGHSSGAHLAALAVLAAAEYTPVCPDPVVAPDALVGLAGTYDVSMYPGLARRLFGVDPETDPDLWESGNPVLAAGSRPEVPVLLIHGDADDLVPISSTTAFGSALEEGGHPITVETVAGADHHQVYSADASGDLIAAWLKGLGPPALTNG
jgi:acetyl esterase/lipase